MRVRESVEDYLEMILILQRKNGSVRAIDIVRELNYSKPSVSVAMKSLQEDGLVIVDENHAIRLTDQGMAIAEAVYEKHVFLSNFLMQIGVDETTAVKDACRIEHVISQDTFEKLKKAVSI